MGGRRKDYEDTEDWEEVTRSDTSDWGWVGGCH